MFDFAFLPDIDFNIIFVGCWSVGLIDNDEMPSEAAIRELKEETGYVGTVSSVSPGTSIVHVS